MQPKVYTVKHCQVHYVGTHRTLFVTSKPTIAKTIRSYILSTGMPSYLDIEQVVEDQFLMKLKSPFAIRRPLQAGNITIEHEDVEQLISRTLYANMSISVINDAELQTDEHNNLALLLTQEQCLAPSNSTVSESYREFLDMMYQVHGLRTYKD